MVEFTGMVVGQVVREQRQRELVAWQTAHLLNISGKSLRKQVTTKHLLRGQDRTEDEEQVLLGELWERVESDRALRGVT